MATFLLVDDQEELRRVFAVALEARPDTVVVQASSGNEAIRILSARRDFDCIICDYQMPEGTGGDVHVFLMSQSIAIPFVLCSSVDPEDCPEFAARPPAGTLRKPFTLAALDEVLRRVLKGAVTPEPEYFRVRPEIFLEMTKTRGDLHLKLADGKFVKFFSGQEKFGEADLRHLREKRIEHVYLRRHEFHAFVEALMLEIFSTTGLKSTDAATVFRVAASVHSVGQDLVLQFGIDERTGKLIQGAVSAAISSLSAQPRFAEVIGRLKPSTDPEKFNATHSVLLAYVSCAISAVMGWNTEASFLRLGLAAFLHDVALEDPRLARASSLEEVYAAGAKFTDEQRKAFERHPARAAELARSLSGMPLDLDVIIEQHHERPDGGGFPRGLDSLKIQPRACVLIVAEQLVTRVLDDGLEAGAAEGLEKHAKAVLTEYTDGFFKSILTAALAAITGEAGAESPESDNA